MKTLGLVGGGQLGMMLTEAALQMSEHVSRVVALDPTGSCPASKAGAEQILGAYDDHDATLELAGRSDVLTYEFEGGNTDALESVISSGTAIVEPSPSTLKIIKDKLVQKEFLASHGIPVPDFAPVSTPDEIKAFLATYGRRAILKARRGGYDGKGNLEMRRAISAEAALKYFGERPVMLERRVNYEMEVSVVIARNTEGQTAAYPAVENIHESGILHTTIAPARTNKHVMRKALEVAKKTLGVLDGAGVFGIEMFVTRGGDILVNEIAPRVHNSGHHTLHSCSTSQFEQHIRAVLGMDLGSTEIRRPTVMHNILGPELMEGAYAEPKTTDPDVHIKMYKKDHTKPLRKLGHANIVGQRDDDVGSLLEKLEQIKHTLCVREKSAKARV